MKVSVILVSPKGSANVGGVARAMGNFGIDDLRIVNPRCDLEGDDCRRMAMQSYGIIESAKLFRSLKEAQEDLKFTIALSGKSVREGLPQEELFSFAPKLKEKSMSLDSLGVIFGREETGLRRSELILCDTIVTIATGPKQPSINLTSAVSITLATLFQMGGMKSEKAVGNVQRLRPVKQTEEAFFERLYRVLSRVQFLNPQNPEHILDDLRAIFHRADLDEREMRIVFGIMTNIETALQLIDRAPLEKKVSLASKV